MEPKKDVRILLLQSLLLISLMTTQAQENQDKLFIRKDFLAFGPDKPVVEYL